MTTFKIAGELKEIVEQFILEWIQLHYHEVKDIQQIRNKLLSEFRQLYLKQPRDTYRGMIDILFHSYNEEVVNYIMKQKKIKNSHKIPIIQHVIEYYKTNFNTRYVDDILNWEKFDNLSYLVQHLMRIYVKDNVGEELIFQIFEGLENETVVLK